MQTTVSAPASSPLPFTHAIGFSHRPERQNAIVLTRNARSVEVPAQQFPACTVDDAESMLGSLACGRKAALSKTGVALFPGRFERVSSGKGNASQIQRYRKTRAR
jgi:hypothetical protein